jgi:signal transduction histidine kinase
LYRVNDGAVRIGKGDRVTWLGPGVPVEIANFVQRRSTRVLFEFYDMHHGPSGPVTQPRPLPSLLQNCNNNLDCIAHNEIFTIDPLTSAPPAAPPPALIRSVSAGSIDLPLSKDKTIVVPSGIDNLHIQFSALSYSVAERVKFRYKLHGVDSDWQVPVARHEAFYTNLHPGTYQFEVTIADENGSRNLITESTQIIIQPNFIQSIWFKFLLFGVAIGIFYALHVFRNRMLSQCMQARLAERARIARTLHDTLLQGIQGVILSFRAHAELVPQGSVGRSHIEYTLKSAEELLIQGRDEILGLRTRSAEEFLYHSLVKFGKSTTAGRTHKFSSELIGEPRYLTEKAYNDVYAITREVICNASRYSNARCISLKMTYSNSGLKVEIQDDGCGLAGKISGNGLDGGWGICGIQERAANIGARLNIISEINKGTSVSLFIKAKTAFLR